MSHNVYLIKGQYLPHCGGAEPLKLSPSQVVVADDGRGVVLYDPVADCVVTPRAPALPRHVAGRAAAVPHGFLDRPSPGPRCRWPRRRDRANNRRTHRPYPPRGDPISPRCSLQHTNVIPDAVGARTRAFRAPTVTFVCRTEHLLSFGCKERCVACRRGAIRRPEPHRVGIP